MARLRRFQYLSAAVSIVAAGAVEAAGLGGGLAGLSIIVFLLLTPVAMAFLVLAFAFRAAKKPRTTRVFSALSVLMAVLLLLLGSRILNRPLIESLNPWWDSDAAFTVTVCLTLILGNVIFFVRRLRLASIAVLSTAIGLAIQFVYTPGRSIYYNHDPLAGEATALEELDRYHAAWNGQVLRFTEYYVRRYLSPQATASPNDDGTYIVEVSLPNDDPRPTPRGPYRSTRSTWEYRFPYQPTHVAVVVATDAVMLDEDWQADDDMLIDVVRYRASPDWLEEVVARGADPNHIDENGDSPLLINALGEARSQAQLIELGADPNLRLGGGDTVLHRIARLAPRKASTLGYLIDNGADPTIRNDAGNTPLEVAELHVAGTLPNSEERYAGLRLVRTLQAKVAEWERQDGGEQEPQQP